eukprot:TRINITY_DN739_c2_g1_i1.p1 TRINITY_DN739_c2_g1~~TRINITY_DN739_c2_g1_i1.p1  ORF type:complete len:508 (+),score=58.54 TRINITY_DN739_c2_g1_i1:43-1566(+)
MLSNHWTYDHKLLSCFVCLVIVLSVGAKRDSRVSAVFSETPHSLKQMKRSVDGESSLTPNLKSVLPLGSSKVSCEWKGWSVWSECSKGCGTGFQFRKQSCLCNFLKGTYALSDPLLCEGSLAGIQYATCYSDHDCDGPNDVRSYHLDRSGDEALKYGVYPSEITKEESSSTVSLSTLDNPHVNSFEGFAIIGTKSCGDTKEACCQIISWSSWSDCTHRCGNGVSFRKQLCFCNRNNESLHELCKSRVNHQIMNCNRNHCPTPKPLPYWKDKIQSDEVLAASNINAGSGSSGESWLSFPFLGNSIICKDDASIGDEILFNDIILVGKTNDLWLALAQQYITVQLNRIVLHTMIDERLHMMISRSLKLLEHCSAWNKTQTIQAAQVYKFLNMYNRGTLITEEHSHKEQEQILYQMGAKTPLSNMEQIDSDTLEVVDSSSSSSSSISSSNRHSQHTNNYDENSNSLFSIPATNILFGVIYSFLGIILLVLTGWVTYYFCSKRNTSTPSPR